MDHVELLTVKECFGIGDGDGVFLVPDFPVPKRGWRDRSEAVVIVKPDGQEIKTRAQFGVAHFNIAGPASLDQRWRVVVRLPACERDQVPIGSKLQVSSEIKDELHS
jgi:hypothetical protein